ncbi:hypothetical protein D3C87_1018860 [compost metagenome]
MFNDLVVGTLRVTSYLVLIVAALFALYIVVMAFRQLATRKPKPAAPHGTVFAATEPEKRAPESRDAGNRR